MRKILFIILLSVCLPTIIIAQEAGGHVVRRTQKMDKPKPKKDQKVSKPAKKLTQYNSNAINKNKLKGAFVICDGMKYEFHMYNGNWALSKGKDSCYVKIKGAIDYKGETFPVKQIMSNAFRNMQKVEKVDISEGVEFISPEAFWGCTKLYDIHFPKSLREISDNVFCYCTNLKQISFNSTKIYLAHSAFRNSGIVSIRVPDEFRMGNNPFTYCSQLQEIIVSKGNKRFDSRNNCNAIILTETNRLEVGCINTLIPDGIRYIGFNAFTGSNLTSINIPEGVELIDMNAFYDCKLLKYIRLPQSLKKILSQAFYGCDIEESVKIPNGVTEIGSKAFASNIDLKKAYIPVSSKVADDAFDEHVQIIRY